MDARTFIGVVLAVVLGEFSYNAILFGLAFLHTDQWVLLLAASSVTLFIWFFYAVFRLLKRRDIL